MVKEHEGKKKLYSIKAEAVKFNRELQTPDLPPKDNELATSDAKRVKATAKLGATSTGSFIRMSFIAFGQQSDSSLTIQTLSTR